MEMRYFVNLVTSEKETSMRRRSTLKAILLAPFAVFGVNALQPSVSQAAPNGTRPTTLSNLSVVSVSATRMRVRGRYATLSGFGPSGMAVHIYAVGGSYFTRWATVYTNNGDFTWEGNKVSLGERIQIEVEGNGAYSRPYPTFSRP